jgi:hypothetical protein
MECGVERQTRDRDDLRPPGAEADVHPLVLRVPPRLVREGLLIECRVELAVDDRERVADERFGHAAAVVIRRLQADDVLDEVDAEQERVARGERACERGEDLLFPRAGSGGSRSRRHLTMARQKRAFGKATLPYRGDGPGPARSRWRPRSRVLAGGCMILTKAGRGDGAGRDLVETDGPFEVRQLSLA